MSRRRKLRHKPRLSPRTVHVGTVVNLRDPHGGGDHVRVVRTNAKGFWYKAPSWESPSSTDDGKGCNFILWRDAASVTRHRIVNRRSPRKHRR